MKQNKFIKKEKPMNKNNKESKKDKIISEIKLYISFLNNSLNNLNHLNLDNINCWNFDVTLDCFFYQIKQLKKLGRTLQKNKEESHE